MICLRGPPRAAALGSGETAVGHLGHHTGRHVVEVVAVEQPAARIVRIDGDPDLTGHRHEHGFADCSGNGPTVQGENLEVVPVQMHRMGPLALAQHLQFRALALRDSKRLTMCQGPPRISASLG